MDMFDIQTAMAQKVEAQKQAKARSEEGGARKTGSKSTLSLMPYYSTRDFLHVVVLSRLPSIFEMYGSAGRTTTWNGCVTMANGEYSQKTTCKT